MNLHNDWMSDNSLFGDDYSKNIVINKAKERFDIQRNYSTEGFSVLIDGIVEQVLIQNYTNSMNENREDRKIHCGLDSIIKRGSIIDWQNNKYLVVTEIDSNLAYLSAKMQQCSNTLIYHDQNHTIHNIPCIVDSNTRFQDLRLEENKFISEPDDKITIRIAYNDITKNIERGQIFKLTDDNYKVISVNKVTEPGLIVLKMKYSIEEAEIHNYTIEILNGDSVNIQEGYTVQLNCNVYDNGTLLSPTPLLNFLSSDESIATVSESGLITAQELGGNGICVVAVSLASDSGVSKDIVVNVIQMPIINFTYEIVGSSDIVKGQTQTYTVNKYNNGILVPDTNFAFEVINGSTPSNAYNLFVLNSNQFKITANQAVYYITLKAVDSSNGEFIEKQIRLKNIF